MPGNAQAELNAQQIMDAWAKKPLDFDPGTKWQYSNTNYVIAGVIVEKVARMPLLQFLEQKFSRPWESRARLIPILGRSAANDPRGYLRFALGPLRPAPKEGKGWNVCRRRVGDDCRGPREVGRLSDRSESFEARVVSRDGN